MFKFNWNIEKVWFAVFFVEKQLKNEEKPVNVTQLV